MTGPAATPRRRRWADLLVIVTGVYLLAVVVWAPALVAPQAFEEEARFHGLIFAAGAVAGALALASVFVALRRTGLARLTLGLAVVILLLSLFAYERVGWPAVLTSILPAVVLLGCLPFLGPMPTPEEEKDREERQR